MKTELRNLFKDLEDDMRSFFDDSEFEQGDRDIATVSYTHLTLPTTPYV